MLAESSLIAVSAVHQTHFVELVIVFLQRLDF
jgi:hypothetical protein